jgi:hypothetical protein
VPRRITAAWLGAPLAFAVPVAIGIAISIARVISSPWPNLGWAVAVSSDAGSYLLGHAPYGDPAHAYTGQLYTPFFPLVISLIDRVAFWEGWPLLLNILATVAGICLVAWMALPTPPPGATRGGRLLRVGAAAGIGALGWSLLFGLEANLVYQGRADHLAWVLALGGLIAWPRAVRGSGRAALVACALLTLAFWTKQSTAVAVVAALIWSLVALQRGVGSPRMFAALLGGLLVVNGLILLIFELTSDGWQRYIEFQLPSNYARPTSAGHALSEFARHGTLALVATAGLSIAALAGARGRIGEVLGRERADTAYLLAVFLVVGLLGAIYFRRLVGAEDNQFLGVMWALALVAAAAWRCAGASPRGAAAGLAVLAILAVSTALPAHSALSLRRNAWIPKAHVHTVPSDVRAFARRHDTYNAFFSDLGVPDRKVVYQHYQALQDLLWGGRQPGRLVMDLLNRRIEVAYLMPADLDSAGAGRWEEGWFWKLDEVIRHKYVRDPSTPRLIGASGRLEHGWRRRPGPDPAPWLAGCFGPFELAGHEFRISTGGGLWCVPAPGTNQIEMRGTPAALTVLQTSSPVERIGGELGVSLPARSGAWRIVHGGWSIEGAVSSGPDGIRVTTPAGNTLVRADALHATAGRVRLRFGGAGRTHLGTSAGVVEVPSPPPEEAPFELWTQQGSGARFDLSRLVLT